MDLEKKEMRQFIKSRLQNIPATSLKTKDLLISQNLRDLIEELLASSEEMATLGVFAPIDHEVKWQTELLGYQASFAFPKVQHHSPQMMQFYPSTFDNLGNHSQLNCQILEPESNKDPIIPDLMILPGLGVDLRGIRLGRGGGFYDRYLKDFSGITIFPCYEEQIFSTLPCENHDQKVQYIVYEHGTIKINKDKKRLI